MYKKVLIDGLTLLPRQAIRSILLFTDLCVANLALLGALGLVYGAAFLSEPYALVLLGLFAICAPAVSYALNLERIKLVLLGTRDMMRIFTGATALSALAACSIVVLNLPNVMIFTPVFCVFLFTGMVLARVLAVTILGSFREQLLDRQPVAIFGAGGSGIQLASALRQSSKMRPLVFFDDNPALQGMEIGGVPVLSPKELIKDLRKFGIEKLLIALPESANQRQKALVEICARVDVTVQILPTFVDMLARQGSGGEPQPVAPTELLGREKVDLEIPEIARSYAGRVVLVTGAGGSIGSELCKQLIACRPAKILLMDHNEFNLYRVSQDMEERMEDSAVEVKSALGSVTDPIRVRHLIESEKVDIILHAAAYKHVPIVEENELEGARNNVIGTKVVADAAAELGIERFILVSTDKAVRPTNIMGATKRMAELVVQDVQTRAHQTKFAMVRFGNVLGSSGSVLPLFMSQIEAGGPVTVTHADVCRYFMTISEASRLVLLAGAYAEGGDMFLLDMGKPQRIMEIAKRLITLSGRTPVDPETGEGDIEIKVTGLRPGEKLYEELLIDRENLRQTPHPKILRAKEDALSEIEIAGMMREILAALETTDVPMLRAIVKKRVDGYHQHSVPLNAQI